MFDRVCYLLLLRFHTGGTGVDIRNHFAVSRMLFFEGSTLRKFGSAIEIQDFLSFFLFHVCGVQSDAHNDNAQARLFPGIHG